MSIEAIVLLKALRLSSILTPLGPTIFDVLISDSAESISLSSRSSIRTLLVGESKLSLLSRDLQFLLGGRRVTGGIMVLEVAGSNLVFLKFLVLVSEGLISGFVRL